MDELLQPLQVGQYYHIYNRGNNRENLFYKADNYRYFLEKYKKYSESCLDTFAYCLLPNHFHLLVQVKAVAHQISKFPSLADLETRNTARSGEVSEQLRRFFISYAKAINKQEGRVGSLFQKYFRRKQIDNPTYLINMVLYIHNNPCHHGIFDSIQDYPYSSYQSLISESNTSLLREDVLNWFGGKNEFIEAHKGTVQQKNDLPFWIEDKDKTS